MCCWHHRRQAAVAVTNYRRANDSTVAGGEAENYSTVEGRSATSSEMVPEVVEEQNKNDKKASPAIRSTLLVDEHGKVVLALTEMILDEPGEDLRTMLGVKNVGMERRLPSGMLFWWIVAAAACALIAAAATVLRTANKSVAFYFRPMDEANLRRSITPTFSMKEVSQSASLGLGEYPWEHADSRSDEHQYRIPATFVRTGAWSSFNSRKTVSKSRKIRGEVALELDWFVEINMGVRIYNMWDLNGLRKLISTDTAGGHRFSVTGI